jgi:hypothetical protein
MQTSIQRGEKPPGMIQAAFCSQNSHDRIGEGSGGTAGCIKGQFPSIIKLSQRPLAGISRSPDTLVQDLKTRMRAKFRFFANAGGVFVISAVSMFAQDY